MPSLKSFRQMSGLPDSIRRWKDAAEQVKAGQKALAEQAARRSMEKRIAEARRVSHSMAGLEYHTDEEVAAMAEKEAPMDWHPQVHREHAEADGRKPEDFRWDQWPVSSVRLLPSENWRFAFHYACDYAKDTPLDNQYDAHGNRLPDPVGMCLQSVRFRLCDAESGKTLGEQDSLPAEGYVRSQPGRGDALWNRLTPDTSIKVKLVAWPMFYFLAEDGGMQGHYAVGHQGHFKGAEIESPVYTLAMDHDGNVTIAP